MIHSLCSQPERSLEILLEVRRSNQAARALSKLGYIEDGVRLLLSGQSRDALDEFTENRF